MAVTTLILCAHRTLTIETFVSILATTNRPGWSLLIECGDALISRSRSIAVSRWLRELPDEDSFLMVDDDFLFTAEDADAVVNLAIDKQGISAGVVPLRSGDFTTIVPLGGRMSEEPWLDPEYPPTEIKWAGGFLAYHRSVFEKMTFTLPLLHKGEPTLPSFWPFFMPTIYDNGGGRGIYLSEDYAMHQRARDLGFTVWVQPKAQIGHVANLTVTPSRMQYARGLVGK